MNQRLAKALSTKQWRYQISGLIGRLRNHPLCPSCGTRSKEPVDRKGMHQLLRCPNCELLFRFPVESEKQMRHFYQDDYEQAGMTTDLPNDEDLAVMMSNGFANTSKDFSTHIDLFKAIGVKPGQRVLDFGANWGYTTFQLEKAGFDAEGFELSKPRAEFAKRLGVNVSNDKESIACDFDLVYSSHVLEHVPDPTATIREMLAWTRPGGWVIAHTPNGSQGRRNSDYRHFHQNWGLVHPVLLNDQYVQENFGEYACFLSTDESTAKLAAWNQDENVVESCDGSVLFFVIKKASK